MNDQQHFLQSSSLLFDEKEKEEDEDKEGNPEKPLSRSQLSFVYKKNEKGSKDSTIDFLQRRRYDSDEEAVDHINGFDNEDEEEQTIK